MALIDRLRKIGLVPVVAFDNAEQAVETARALRAGGLDTIEITMRTAAGIDSIKAVRKEFPDMVIGAGTILTKEKAKEAVDSGAEYVVSPGYDADIVTWCVENDITVLPGCVTPGEIQQALAKGVKVLKFFPADVYGGIKALKALNGPFGPYGVTFVPTGGVDIKNLAEFVDAPFVAAVGGSWLASSKDIKAGNWAGITKSVEDSIDILLGFEFAHVGVNAADEAQAADVAQQISKAFRFPYKPGNSSDFAGTGVEVMKSPYLGAHGHAAVRTNSIERAEYYLTKRGFALDESTAKAKDGKTTAVYLKGEIGGFAFHLLQK